MITKRPKTVNVLKNEQPMSLSCNSPRWVSKSNAQLCSTGSFRMQASSYSAFFNAWLSRFPWTLSFPSARGRKGVEEQSGTF